MVETLFFATLAVAVLEAGLQIAWVPLYWRMGIPIYRRRVDCATEPRLDQLDASLEKEFSGGFGPPLRFRVLGPDELAFRERMLQLRLLNYTPIMRGLIQREPGRRTVTISGYLNWYVVAFLVLWYGALLEPGPTPVLTEALLWFGAPVVIAAAIYLLQAHLYNRVARHIGHRLGGA